MATKIKRSLFIGLGGTGMTALLHTKRMFIDTYGEVPPMVGFLGIDTDGDWYSRDLVSKYGRVILEPNEQLPILVLDAQPIYKVHQDRFAWLPEKNLKALTSMKLGAGMIRTNGRFAFTVNYDDVKVKLMDVLNRITSASHISNTDYELLGAADVEIHMVFSVAGGTGSGIFLNMAYAIKEVAPGCKLMGYAVLPDVFRAMSGTTMGRVKANGYAAIEDLDWFMHLTMGSEPHELLYIRGSQLASQRPFNSVVFIDNKNRNNDSYDHVDKLTEMISLALVTAAGQLSQASASVNDNLEKCIRDGEMDIEGKMAWAGGMGASEIVFRGEDLSDIYAIKAANFVIDNMLNTGQDVDAIVNSWIDSPEVKIRENNGFDNVIDFMLDKNPKFGMGTINEAQNAQAEIDGYVASSMPKDDDLTERCNELQERVRNEFHKLMVTEINKPCGVGSVEKILVRLKAQFDIMMREMRQEREQMLQREPQQVEAIKAAVNDVKEYDSRFFKRTITLEEKKQQAMSCAYDLVVTRREIKRRDMAIQFYTFMNVMINDAMAHVAAVRQKLEGVYRDNAERLSVIQNRIDSDNQLFQIDLAQNYVTQIRLNTEEVNINDLLNSIPGSERFYSIASKNNNEVAQTIYDYTKGLNGSRRWSGMTIEQIFDEMSESDFNNLVDIALRKSMPLFTYNHQGYMPTKQPTDIYFLGIPSKNCRFNKAFVKGRVKGVSEVDESIIGMKNRVIIYRQIGVVPAYAISAVPSCKIEYDNSTADSHIDALLTTRMVREEYSLMPSRAADNTLDFWVKGIIFGLIRNDGECYYYKDVDNSDAALDDFWIKLSPYRDDSYSMFRRVCKSVESQYEQHFNGLQREKGDAYLRSIIDDAKANYLVKYSQIMMPKDEIKKKGNEAVARLITDEINYVTKQL